MPERKSAGEYTPHDNQSTASQRDSYTRDTGSNGDLPARVAGYTFRTSEKPAEGGGVRDHDVNRALDGLVDFLDERRELPTHIRSKHLDGYTTLGQHVVGRALRKLARTDDPECPLRLDRWNDDARDGAAAIWRVERRDA